MSIKIVLLSIAFILVSAQAQVKEIFMPDYSREAISFLVSKKLTVKLGRSSSSVTYRQNGTLSRDFWGTLIARSKYISGE